MLEDIGTRQPAILAIDPGATSGVVVVSLGRQVHLLHHEVWKKAAKRNPTRPSQIVARLLEQFDIESAVIEDQFFKKNLDSLKKLSRTSGNWEEACLSHGLDVQWVAPVTWQARILGSGLGQKRDQIDQAMKMVAYQDTRVALTADESAAWCIGRFVVEQASRKSVLSRAKIR